MFDDQFVRTLPIDRSNRIGTRQVTGACASLVAPTRVSAPTLVALSTDVADQLGIPSPLPTEWIEALAGNRVIDGMVPYAACYGGHQFGHWAGQLGDGRAITLTEIQSNNGNRYELQLKGAGPTPYSRNADGRAVMRSSLREFVCSEAMHHLGIATTRALSLIATGDMVVRDMFYNGHARPEPGAICSRVAPTFLRFGNFELPSQRGDVALLRQLADYTMSTHFGGDGGDYLQFFYQVCLRTASMVIDWMRVGFVHGVMNTDNMSILGLTIDYGPYGWLEPYDPRWTPNTTDADGRRYAFGAQPRIAQWNLAQLARALRPLINNDAALAAGIDMYWREFTSGYRTMMFNKLGLATDAVDDDDALLAGLFEIFAITEIDFTLFFRGLHDVPTAATSDSQAAYAARVAPLRPAFYQPEAVDGSARLTLTAWLEIYCERARTQDGQPKRREMNRVNPLYVPRNYLAQLAIEALDRGDSTFLDRLLVVGRSPYEQQVGAEQFAEKRPEWARQKAGCSMLSCSS
jgi:serine/tyrosine/threonine adenylyltransferase